MLFKKLNALIIVLLFSLYAYAKIENRCAVDIGSGWMKMQTAAFDTESNQIIKLDEPFLDYVPLANYFAQDGMLNDEIQKQAQETFKKIIEICKQKNVTKLSGIATEIFRKAGISGELLFKSLQIMAQKELGIERVNLQLISQELEGELGFLTALALSPELSPKSIVSWDSGNASFQLVMQSKSKANQYIMFADNIGSAIAAQLFAKAIRKRTYQRGAAINPINPKEIAEFVNLLSESIIVPNDFINEIHAADMNIVSIGNQTSIFCLAANAIGKNKFSSKELKEIINKYAQLEPNSEHIAILDAVEPETVLTRLMLLYAVMKKLSIKSVIYKASIGGTLGILHSKQFWN